MLILLLLVFLIIINICILIIMQRLKKKIAQVGVEKFEFVQEYNNISPALLIYFKDGSVMPIREHKFLEYVALIDKNGKFGE